MKWRQTAPFIILVALLMSYGIYKGYSIYTVYRSAVEEVTRSSGCQLLEPLLNITTGFYGDIHLPSKCIVYNASLERLDSLLLLHITLYNGTAYTPLTVALPLSRESCRPAVGYAIYATENGLVAAPDMGLAVFSYDEVLRLAATACRGSVEEKVFIELAKHAGIGVDYAAAENSSQ